MGLRDNLICESGHLAWGLGHFSRILGHILCGVLGCILAWGLVAFRRGFGVILLGV